MSVTHTLCFVFGGNHWYSLNKKMSICHENVFRCLGIQVDSTMRLPCGANISHVKQSDMYKISLVKLTSLRSNCDIKQNAFIIQYALPLNLTKCTI